ncbi:MAG: hypothetical protein Q4D02_05900 [Clostridia bacterium]|nr:hypothetical protein [Clostridia bacterium]
MFTERLTNKDVKAYLMEHTPCQNDVEVMTIYGKNWRILNYIASKGAKKRMRSINLTDFNFDHIYNKEWCLYLYSLFGEEYLAYYDRLAKVYGMPNLLEE